MQVQVVCCHPLTDSFDHALYRTVVSTLDQNGHGVVATDLYREGFAPAMTVEERRTYMSNDYDASAVARYVEILKQVDGLILCFPHWWFSMPAMLKAGSIACGVPARPSSTIPRTGISGPTCTTSSCSAWSPATARRGGSCACSRAMPAARC